MHARFDLVPLSPREREALRLQQSGFTRAQVAHVLGVTENRVKNLWQAARRKMRKMGGKLTPDPEPRRIGLVSLSDFANVA